MKYLGGSLDCSNRTRLLEYALTLFNKAIYRYVFSILRSRSEADDVTQDVFVGLYLSETNFEDDYHLKCWLYKVAFYKCNNAIRDRRRKKELLFDPMEENTTAVLENGLAAEDELAYVWEAVDALSPDLRSTVYLYYIEGYSTKEIASINGVSSATVRTRLFRARKSLRGIVGGIR